MSLSKSQLAEFRERGYTRLGAVFSSSELAELGAAYDEVLATPLKLGEQGKGTFEYVPLLQMRNSVLLRYATSPKLVRPMIDLLGPDVRLYWDQAVSKPPGATSDVPWHQDNGYTPVVPEEYVTATIALDRQTVDNGCLWIQPGSHRSSTKPHKKTDFFFQIGYEGAETGEPVELEAGEALLFSSLTMHRTGPNRTDEPRRSWIIQFCHGHARHRDTGVAFDDRLLVAKDGRVLEPAVRERPFDFIRLMRYAAGVLAPR
ncbi:MAG: phytanoyl-CoA dioxygenase family protein [Candidatus Binatia bacterium]